MNERQMKQYERAGTLRYELNREAAFGYCEGEYWGICNAHRSIKDPDSIYNPKSNHCRKCRLDRGETKC